MNVILAVLNAFAAGANLAGGNVPLGWGNLVAALIFAVMAIFDQVDANRRGGSNGPDR